MATIFWASESLLQVIRTFNLHTSSRRWSSRNRLRFVRATSGSNAELGGHFLGFLENHSVAKHLFCFYVFCVCLSLLSHPVNAFRWMWPLMVVVSQGLVVSRRDGWMDTWMDTYMNTRTSKQVDRWIYGKVAGWVHEHMDAWTNKWMNE